VHAEEVMIAVLLFILLLEHSLLTFIKDSPLFSMTPLHVS